LMPLPIGIYGLVPCQPVRLPESAGIAGRELRAPHQHHLPMTPNTDAGLGPKCLNLDKTARLLRERQSRLDVLRRQRSHVRIVSVRIKSIA
jgi:hypothetical protein